MKTKITFFLFLFIGTCLLSSNVQAQDCPDDFQISHERVCGTDSYDVFFSVSGGTAPYAIDGDYNGVLTEGEEASFSKNDGEDYSLTATDAAGCDVSIETDLTPCSKLEDCPDTYQVDHIRDCGPILIDGAGEYDVIFSVSGGTAPYSVSGNFNGVLGEGEETSFSVADGAGYEFTVTDANNCEIVIEETEVVPCSKAEECPESYQVDHVRNCEPVFAGGGEYEVIFSAAGGTAPYVVTGGLFNGILGEGEETSFFVSDGSGYSFVVTDASNCRIEISEDELLPCSKIDCPPSFAVVDTFDCANIEGEGTYDVIFSVSGGTAPYIVGGDFSGLLTEGEEAIFAVTDGEGYTLTVSDADNCELNIEREAPFCSKSCPGPQAIVEVDCTGAQETGEYSVSITVSGTVPPYLVTGTLGDIILTGEGETISGTITNGDQLFVAIQDAEECGPTIIDTTYNCRPDVAVELLTFEGEATQEGNVLSWSTASETNNDFFTILHATDGANFEVIGQIEGQGNTNGINTYNFIDKNASTGLNYYYLIQTDIDGTTTSYDVIVVSRGEADFDIIRLFPMPAHEMVTLTITNDQMAPVDVSLYDITGRVVMNKTVNTSVGVNEVNINVTNLSKGVYFVKVNDGIRTKADVLLKD